MKEFKLRIKIIIDNYKIKQWPTHINICERKYTYIIWKFCTQKAGSIRYLKSIFWICVKFPIEIQMSFWKLSIFFKDATFCKSFYNHVAEWEFQSLGLWNAKKLSFLKCKNTLLFKMITEYFDLWNKFGYIITWNHKVFTRHTIIT